MNTVDGWIKLYRKTRNSPVFNDPEIYRLWTLCLLSASYKERRILMNKNEIALRPGQFVTGRNALFEDYNYNIEPTKRVKDTTLWNWLKKLEMWGMIDIKSTTKYSIVSIVNWDEYQGGVTTERQQIDNELTTEQQQIDTNKKEKKEKKGGEWEEDDIPFL